MPVLDFPSAHLDEKAASRLPPVAFEILGGRADPRHLKAVAAADLKTRDLLYTLTVMGTCGDLKTIDRQNRALTAGELYAAVRLLREMEFKVNLDGHTALEIADREDVRQIMSAILGTDWLGHIAAGYIVRWVVSRSLSPGTRAQASLNAAAGKIEEWCKTHRITGGGRQNIIRHLWPSYKPVAHLWASFYLMLDAGIDLCTIDGFKSFLGTAQWLLEKAVTFVPNGRRAGETLLSRAETWEVPLANGCHPIIWNDELDDHDIRTKPPPAFLAQNRCKSGDPEITLV